MGHSQRQKLIFFARLAKVSLYSALCFGYYRGHTWAEAQRSDHVFDALVLRPLKKDSTKDSKVFYQRRQVDSMHRAYLLKANQMQKDNESLKKYKYDP